jgi:peptidoglycan hydrolase CwlO-like protein
MPPSKSSLADIILDADKLLAAVVNNAALLTNIDEQRVPLEQALADVRTANTRQQNLTAERQAATQDLTAAVARVRDLTIQLRATIKGKLGVRTEKLVEFRVQPLRKRSRTAAAQPLKPPADPQATTPKPAG